MGDDLEALQVLNLPLGYEADGAIHPTNEDGQPAPVEVGSFIAEVFSIDEPGYVNDATLVILDDSNFTVRAGSLGKSCINLMADADLGPGVATIPAVFEVEVTLKPATKLGLTFGAPRPQVVQGPAPDPAPEPTP